MRDSGGKHDFSIQFWTFYAIPYSFREALEALLSTPTHTYREKDQHVHMLVYKFLKALLISKGLESLCMGGLCKAASMGLHDHP